MNRLIIFSRFFMICYAGILFQNVTAYPNLPIGKWTAINPPVLTFTDVQGSGTSFVQGLAVDPENPSTIYLTSSNFAADQGLPFVDGLYKTTDGGSNWSRIGRIQPPWAGADSFINEGTRVRVDPNNSQHLYCGDGVHGQVIGFYVSNDGGATFAIPHSLDSIQTATGYGLGDVYDIAVDPSDFNHVLVSFHSPWKYGDAVTGDASGIIESKDGGVSWILHLPVTSWGTGHSVWFLKGNSTTWLIGTQGNGFWRTTNSGGNWTQVTTVDLAHGGGETYYAKSGVLYAACANGIMRSSDNGVTFTVLTGSGVPTFCNGIFGDGNVLYAHYAYDGSMAPWYTSPETDGNTWTAQTNAGSFQCGPFEMAFDAVNRIVYSSNWATGLLALKLPATGVEKNIPANKLTRGNFGADRAFTITGDRLVASHDLAARAKEANIYDVKGMLVGRFAISSDGLVNISKNKSDRQVYVVKVQ